MVHFSGGVLLFYFILFAECALKKQKKVTKNCKKSAKIKKVFTVMLKYLIKCVICLICSIPHNHELYNFTELYITCTDSSTVPWLMSKYYLLVVNCSCNDDDDDDDELIHIDTSSIVLIQSL